MAEYLHPTEKQMAFSNLVQVARYQANQQGQKKAYTFLLDGENQERHLSYREVDQKARAIAAILQEGGLSGERALLVYPPGLDFICAFFGCLYAGVIAVPTYPPVNRQMLSTVESILRDAGPKAILTNLDILSKLNKIKFIQSIGKKSFLKIITKRIDHFFPVLKILNKGDVRLIPTDGVDTGLAHMWQEPDLHSDSLALLQYTSGSTSQPKGVMVSHGNIIHNQNLIQHYMQTPKGVVIPGWLPQYHDMGLLGTIFHPFYLGGRSILLSPFDFLKKPLRWLAAISKYRGYLSGCPNFGYELCIRKVSPEDKKKLDLSSWKIAFNGAEPIRHSTLENFATYFSDCGFRKSAFFPCYGLAEGTLMVTGGKQKKWPVYLSCDKEKLKENKVNIVEPDDPNNTVLVGSGTAFNKQNIIVVDPDEFIQLPENEIGEVWVSGASVAHGYWNNAQSTREIFQARLKDTKDGPFLRTGDLGFIRDGDLFIAGRLKDLIIVRGQNYHPNDIEYSVENSHSNLRKGCSAAFSDSQDGEEKLIVVSEIRKKIKKTGFKNIVNSIIHNISENHGINISKIVLIKARTIPKTTSGKIRRKMCKLSLLNNKLNIIYQWDDKAGKESSIEHSPHVKKNTDKTNSAGSWSKDEVYRWLLGKINKTSAADINLTNLDEKTLYDTGLDSMKLIELAVEFERKFICKVIVEEFFDQSSLLGTFEYLYETANTSSN